MEKNIHYMNLLHAPFCEIKEGRKTVEMRLFDEKRQKIRSGDEIVFSCDDFPNETVCVCVKEISVYKNFRDLAEDFTSEELGFAECTKEYIAEFMEKIYSAEKTRKYGACAITVALVK